MLPVGAQMSLTGDELISGSRGIAFRKGRAFHIEEVREDARLGSSDTFVLTLAILQHAHEECRTKDESWTKFAHV